MSMTQISATYSSKEGSTESSTDISRNIVQDKWQPMRVLLVEDSKLISDALLEVLGAGSDLKVEGVATTQNEAIALLKEQPFDMLLVDIELAQGNGFEVIKYTKTDAYVFKAPVIIMLTNHANAIYRRIAKELDVQYFFDKSMDFDLTIETIAFEASKFSNTTS